MRSLGRRAQFRRELNEKLKKRGFEESVREEVLSRLEELGYLSDCEVAEKIKDRELAKGLSFRALRYKIQSRGGTPPEESKEEEKKALLRYIEKKAKELETEKGRERLIRSLQRRGHSFGEIVETLESFELLK